MALLLGLLGIIALALVVVPVTSRAQERAPIAGMTYSGVLTDTTGECSRGVLVIGPAFSFEVSQYGSRIITLGLTDISHSGFNYTASYFPLSVNIQVRDDGTFSASDTQYGVLGHFEGSFEGLGVSGSFRFSIDGVTECEGTFSAETSRSFYGAQTFAGSIDSEDGCGGGTIELSRSADLLSITRAAVDDVRAGDRTVSGSANFEEGTAPISADDGSFDWLYFRGTRAGEEIAISGTFVGGLRGAVTVSPSDCGMMHFQASDSGLAPNAGPGGGRGGPELPATGSRLASTGHGILWLSLAAAFAAMALASGVALARQQRR